MWLRQRKINAWIVLVVCSLCALFFLPNSDTAVCGGICMLPVLMCVAFLLIEHAYRSHKDLKYHEEALANAPVAPMLQEAPPLTSPGNNVIKLPTPRYG